MALPKWNLDGLTPEERLELIEQLWTGLTPEQVGLTPAQRVELERRLDDLERNPEEGVSWTDARRDIRERKR